MRETTVERYLVREIVARNGRCIKLLPFVQRGLPDRLVLLPGYEPIFVELKAPTGKLRAMQVRWRDWLKNSGFQYATLYDKQEVKAWLETFRC